MKLLKLILFGLLSFFAGAQSLFAATVKVMTFNAWLLPSILGVSQDIELRRSNMPRHLANSGADVIGFQEVWTRDDQDYLIREMSKVGYPYSARVDSGRHWLIGLGKGALGNGLLVVSKHEIRNHERIQPFSRYTRMDEYFAAKGTMHVEVKLPDVGWADFYNVHLGAVYFDHEYQDWIKEHLENNHEQGREMIEFIHSSRTNPVQLITGDLNIHPESWDADLAHFSTTCETQLYSWLTSGITEGMTSFFDTFHLVRPRHQGIFTYDSGRNRYVAESHMKSEPSIFCDYVFLNRDQSVLKVKDSELMFDQLIQEENQTYFLSDHFGVMTTFETI